MKILNSERGSATVEFFALALPLLVPTLIFFTSLNSAGADKVNISALSRTSVHAFVQSGDDNEGYARVAQLVHKYEELNPGNSFSFTVRCSTRPCIAPNTIVEVALYREGSEGRIRISSARSSVSRWS